MNRRLLRLLALLVVAATLSGCAAGRAFHRGESSARTADWDAAVEYYRAAVQAAPGRADYKIALERAMINASHAHLDRAREFEAKGELNDALREYQKASEFDPPNRQLAAKVQELEKTIRDRIEASRPKPPITEMRERARQTSGEPLLNPASREPLAMKFTGASIRDILNFIGSSTGINVTYDRDFQDRSYTVSLDGVTLEQALQQILSANGLFYKVLNERTIMVISDTPPKRAQYEEQVIRTFYLSHAESTEVAQLLNTVVRVPSMAVQPMIAANKTANTITIRATANVAAIIEKVIEANDNPRAEVVVDVQILEVNRARAKQFGLNLTDYALGAVFSPETAPSGTTTGTGTGTGTGTTAASTGTAPSAVGSPPAFNLNTITRGVSTADFFLAVPAAVVRFLETDSETRLIAKPQLRGAEGEKLTLNLGDEIPVPATVFTPLGAGGAATSPLTSFNYKPVGVNLEMTPRVTFEGDIILDLTVESSTRGGDVNIAGQNLPSFGSRKVKTKLRLRDGESNLLAGLIREDDRKSLTGFPGIIHVPILKQLFSSNNNSVQQTDIVMLLTPRIIRTHELTQQDISPIYIGTQQNLGLGGPPPLIAPPPGEAPPAPAAPGTPQPMLPAGTTQTPVVPPGSSPIPGMTMPTAPAAPAPAIAPAAPGAPATSPTVPSPEPAPTPAAQPPAAGAAQVLITPPGTEFRVGGGPYTVPISITGAQRLSTVTITLSYNPAALRVRNVQEGSFMRQGGLNATFTQQVDAASGRIDIAIARAGDATGATGSGLLAAILFDPVAPGSAQIAGSGAATMPGGGAAGIQVSPVTVTIR